MSQQRMYSFGSVILDLCIVSVCELVKFGKKLQDLTVLQLKLQDQLCMSINS